MVNKNGGCFYICLSLKLMEDFTKKLIEPHWMDVFVWGLLIVIAVYAFYLMFKINQTRRK